MLLRVGLQIEFYAYAVGNVFVLCIIVKLKAELIIELDLSSSYVGISRFSTESPIR